MDTIGEVGMIIESVMRVPVLIMVEIADLEVRTQTGDHAVAHATGTTTVQLIIDARIDGEAIAEAEIQVTMKPP